jgi:pimeloyl-ACP methyl ester carboxylesterase
MIAPRRLRRRWRLLFLAVLFLLLVFYLGVPLLRVYQAMHPLRIALERTPADFGLKFEVVSFPAADGVRLSGWYLPSQNRAAVILSHGFTSNRASLLFQAEALARAGFGVLLYDIRTHGESADALSARGWLEANDVLGALTYLQTRPDADPDRIGAYGFSMGGQITLRAAAQSPAIRAVVVDGVQSGGIDDDLPPVGLNEWLNAPAVPIFYRALEVLTGVHAPAPLVSIVPAIGPRPILFISAGQDNEQRRVRRFYAAAHEPKTLWEIPEAGHGGGWSARPQDYAERLVAFFHVSLLGQ